jgi:Zn-dependent alcohol dehydrogenase
MRLFGLHLDDLRDRSACFEGRPPGGVIAGRILGHEGIGIVEQIGPGVSEFHVGENVIISC